MIGNDYEEIVLDKVKFGQQILISPEVLETATARAVLHRETGDLLVRVGLHVLRRKLLHRLQEQAINFPANPWQHLKQRFAPAWFTRRWPVRYQEVIVEFRVDVDSLYPQARVITDHQTLGVPVFHESGRFDLSLNGDPWPWPETSAVKAAPVTMTYEQSRREVDRILRARPPWHG